MGEQTLYAIEVLRKDGKPRKQRYWAYQLYGTWKMGRTPYVIPWLSSDRDTAEGCLIGIRRELGCPCRVIEFREVADDQD